MKKLTLAAGILLSITGCESTTEVNQQSLSSNQAPLETTTIDAYGQSKLSYEKWGITLAEHQSLKIYSSRLYSDLLNEWNDAKKLNKILTNEPAKVNESYSLFSSSTYAEKFSEKLAEVTKTYADIQKIKEQADPILAESIAQVNYLNKINAKSFLSDEYDDLYDDYTDLFEDVSENQIAEAQSEQIIFLKQAKTFELAVVLKIFVDPLEKQMDKFKDKNIHTTAPISYSKAKLEIDSAIKVVKSDTRNLNAIKQAVANVKFEIDHVQQISDAVTQLSRLNKEKLESVILTFEEQLLSISQSVNGADYRDKTIQTQTELIVAAVIKQQVDHVESSKAYTEKNAKEETEIALIETTEIAPTEKNEATPTETTDTAPTEKTEATPTETTEAATTETTDAAPTETTEAAPTKTTEAAPTKTTEADPTKTIEAAPTATTDAAPTETTKLAL